MTNPTDRRYSHTHQWAKLIDTQCFLVGITDFAQQQLGDIMFIEFPKIDQIVKAGESCATVESVKSASDVYAPLTGTITEINHPLINNPENLNSQPYENWLFKIKCDDIQEYENLLDSHSYQQLVD